MVVELPNFRARAHKTADRVKIVKSDYGKWCYLVAEWDNPPLGFGSRYRSLARAEDEYELKVWWDTQCESIPLSNGPTELDFV